MADPAGMDRSLLSGLALGRQAVDRRADLRDDSAELARYEQVFIVLDSRGELAIDRTADGAALELLGRPQLSAGGLELFLGVDRDDRAYFVRAYNADLIRADLIGEGASGRQTVWAGLREIGNQLGDRDAGLATTAVALANWHRVSGHCSQCGAVTSPGGLGWWRTCPNDGTQHFPRTDPAVIALVLDDDDRALLGRAGRWPIGAFSTLAGFVEPGETAEAAVVREVREEVGVSVATTVYLGSQPWPFPGSLMLGYHAFVSGVGPQIRVDGSEIVEARWFTRDEISQQCQEGGLRLPSPVSIANRLVARWFGSELPLAWCGW